MDAEDYWECRAKPRIGLISRHLLSDPAIDCQKEIDRRSTKEKTGKCESWDRKINDNRLSVSGLDDLGGEKNDVRETAKDCEKSLVALNVSGSTNTKEEDKDIRQDKNENGQDLIKNAQPGNASSKRKLQPRSRLIGMDNLPSNANVVDVKALELPEGIIFPRFPDMMKDWVRLGKPPVMTYNLLGKRRLVVVADPDLFRSVFFPDGVYLYSIQEILAHSWFGIEKDLSKAYTAKGLENTRKALKFEKSKTINDKVASGILGQIYSDFDPKGVAELMDFAWLTFWPVVSALFGEEAGSKTECPHLRSLYEQYNSSLDEVANGMPRKMFPDMEVAAKEISAHFGDMIERGNATREDCPLLKARVEAIDPTDSRWSADDKGRFVLSVFWASQANTVPLTFWALAMCLYHPEVKRKCTAEARSAAFTISQNGKVDCKKLHYINAVVKEVLRLKVANITHRKSLQPFAFVCKKSNDASSVEHYPVQKGSIVTVCSYLQHHDDAFYTNPYEFQPERWLDNTKRPYNSFFPFGGGPNTCSGRFLALQEIATLLAFFFREFDAELIDKPPEEYWANVVATVGPKKPFSCRVRYERVNV